MTTRACFGAVTMLLAAATATAGELPVAEGPKAAVVDCYTDRKLEGPFVTITKAEWPGPIRAKDSGDHALLFRIGARECWIERSEVRLQGIPGPEGCEGSRGSLASRGLGESGSCPDKKKK